MQFLLEASLPRSHSGAASNPGRSRKSCSEKSSRLSSHVPSPSPYRSKSCGTEACGTHLVSNGLGCARDVASVQCDDASTAEDAVSGVMGRVDTLGLECDSTARALLKRSAKAVKPSLI